MEYVFEFYCTESPSDQENYLCFDIIKDTLTFTKGPSFDGVPWDGKFISLDKLSSVAYFIQFNEIGESYNRICGSVKVGDKFTNFIVSFDRINGMMIFDGVEKKYDRYTMSNYMIPDPVGVAEFRKNLVETKPNYCAYVIEGKNGKSPFLGLFLNKPMIIDRICNVDVNDYVKITKITEFAKFFVVVVEKIDIPIGSKITNRYGSNGVICKIIPDEIAKEIVIDPSERPEIVDFHKEMVDGASIHGFSGVCPFENDGEGGECSAEFYRCSKCPIFKKAARIEI